MPPGTANYQRLYRRVSGALDQLDRTTYTNPTPTINDRRRPEGMIRDAIVNKDAAVRAAICMSAKSGHRVRYLSYSGVLVYDVNGAPAIPDHYGPIGQVLIQSVIAGPWQPGVESDRVEQINEWRENAGNVFGLLNHDQANSPLSGYFKEEGTRLNFTGVAARAEIASFDVSGPDTNPPVLGSPDGFEDVIFAGSVFDSYIEGDDLEQAKTCGEYYRATMPMILAGAYEVQPLQQK